MLFDTSKFQLLPKNIKYQSDILTEHIRLNIELSAFDSLDKSSIFRGYVSQAAEAQITHKNCRYVHGYLERIFC